MPLPKQVQAYVMAVSTQKKRKDGSIDSMRGDGLVPIASGLGLHGNSDFDLRIPKSRQWVGHGINHLELLGSQTAYRRIRRWLREPIP